jgi:hypothetical protein
MVAVDNALQKVTLLDSNVDVVSGSCILMVAYADSGNARSLMRRLRCHPATSVQTSSRQANGVLMRLLRDALGLRHAPVATKGMLCSWHAGTHFFRPLPPAWGSRAAFCAQLQHPRPGVCVVGEAVSCRSQGWTQGALESCRAAIDPNSGDIAGDIAACRIITSPSGKHAFGMSTRKSQRTCKYSYHLVPTATEVRESTLPVLLSQPKVHRDDVDRSNI